ncbi:MAG: PAS domain S-box protein [Acidobacteriia bacterium]|nr:PAS domain S-box protein [Terriglobia bacterium]
MLNRKGGKIVPKPPLCEPPELSPDIYNPAPRGLHSVDQEGIFVEINDTELQWLGYRREELVGKVNIQDLLSPVSRELFQQNFSRLKTQGEVYNVEMEFVRKDGTCLHALVSATAITDNLGNFVRSRATVFDVTEQRHEEQLKRRLAAIVESSDDAIIGETMDRIILDWNAGAEAIFGYTAEEMKGRSMAILVPSDRAEEFLEHTEQVKRGEPVRHFETVRLRKDGQEIHVSLTISPIRGPSGNPVGISTIARDITEHKKWDQALMSRERQVRQLLEAAPDAILQIDHEGRIVLANDAAEMIFGYSRSELLAMRVEQLVPEGARGAHIQHRAGYVRHPVTRPMGAGLRLKAQRKDGTQLPVEISLSPNRNGELQVIAIVRDVTERVKAEEMLRQSEEKLRQAEKLEALARLAGGTAHEFNNLLTMVLGYSELLLSAVSGNEDAVGHVDKIRAAAKRAAHLTRQLMAFGSRQAMRPELLDLNAVLVDARHALANLLGDKVETRLLPAAEPMWVWADPVQVHQIIVNLAMNARDAMSEGGKQTLALSSVDIAEQDLKRYPDLDVGPYVLLTVCDTGSGMTPEIQSRIFEPFFSTRQFGKSTGLGLAMVYGIVSQSGGAISVQSQPGQGTTFSIYLPRVTAGQMAQRRSTRPPLGALHGSETILLVEDQAHLLALTQEFLQRLGYRVLPAASAEEAMQVAAAFPGPIHMLLTDVVMPGLNGRQLAKALEASRPEMKVFYVSGFADEAFHGSGPHGRGTAFLEKPFELEELAQKVREIM